MMDAFKRCTGLVLAVLILGLCVSALTAVQTPVQAYDSNDYSWVKDEGDLKTAVNGLPTASSPSEAEKQQIKAVAQRLSHLSDKAKRNVSSSVIRQLAKLYNNAFLSSTSAEDEVTLGDDNDTSTKTVDESESAAYGVSASIADGGRHRLRIDQAKSSGSTLLRMDLDGFDGPIYVDLVLNKKPFSSSKDYYFRVDGKSTRLDASVSTSDGQNHIKFIAPEEGEYKLYQDKDDDDDDDDDDDRDRDYDYSDLSSFWRDVVDDIEDAGSGSRVRVSLGTRSTVPTDVLRALKNRAVTLALTESNGNIISIYGKDVKIPSGSSVSVSTLRSTYDKDTTPKSTTSSSGSSSSSASSSGGTGGLGVSPLPNGIGGSGTGTAGTATGGTGTPSAGGGPLSLPVSPLPAQKLPAATLPVSPKPALPSSSSKDASLSGESSSSDASSQASSFGTEFHVSEPEAENAAVQEPMDLPALPDIAAGGSRISRVVDKVGLAGVLAFMGLAAATAALGGGLLTYAILSHREK